ncbi:hypothetical protein [Methylomonas fluvii]|uniref:Uncharacterized protein n=1 Tax=Methylomonas fluvii TaxID=1854564 RepID=A0ABR9DJ93_9GAMM|nr:hypothetical protein [Methylomonas fluvii]MBD9363169.1 hypothetical protein [Methylomonas fluvii]CAD6876417.1 hypothetical protein [Methylomonas fluvii]
MRHRLLLLAALIAPAHAELHEHEPPEIHRQTLLNNATQISLAASPDLLAPGLCWLPSSLTGNHSANEINTCVMEAIYASGLNRENTSEAREIGAVNWSVMNYPAISSGAWSFIPDIGYQFLLEKTADFQPGQQSVTADSEKSLSAMPLATLTWFVLGCMLGSLAMLRRNQEKLAIVTD